MKINEFKDIKYVKEENGIVTLTFNRPERRNALSFVTFLEMEYAILDFSHDDKARVLIMTGSEEGRAYSTGGYFNMRMMTDIDPAIQKEIDMEDIAVKKLAMKMWDCPKPIIAAINGLAIGVAVTMALGTADLIYMADDATAGLYFVKRAIVPEFGLSFILPFLVGFQRAKEIMYFGDDLSAQKMYELGLINGVVAHNDLMAHCRKVAERLMPPKSPSASIMFMKKAIHDYFREIVSQTLDKENIGLRAMFKTQDFRESTMALSQKRTPEFTGKLNKMVEDIFSKPFNLEEERKRPRYVK